MSCQTASDSLCPLAACLPIQPTGAQNCGDGRSGCSGRCAYAAGSATANSYIAPYKQYFAGIGNKLYYTTLLGECQR